MMKFCLQCNKIFKKARTSSARYFLIQKFCSQKCYGRSLQENPKTCLKNLEKTRTQDAISKMTQTIKGQFKNGRVFAHRHVFPFGSQNPAYIDGRTPEMDKLRKGVRYKKWREAVFARDNWTCQGCGQIGGCLNADHIKPFAWFPKFRFELSNGRTLCKNCHLKTETWGKGSYKFRPTARI